MGQEMGQVRSELSLVHEMPLEITLRPHRLPNSIQPTESIRLKRAAGHTYISSNHIPKRHLTRASAQTARKWDLRAAG